MGVCFKGYLPIAELLLLHGADLNLQHGNGGTALMFATLFGRNDLVRLLMEHGADLNIKDNRGLTALDLAVQQGNPDAVLIMEEYMNI
jgi:ankyrin repeat protein